MGIWIWPLVYVVGSCLGGYDNVLVIVQVLVFLSELHLLDCSGT